MLSRRMQGLWLAFIGDPITGFPTQGWDAYEPGGSFVEYGKGGTLVGSIGFDELESVCNTIIVLSRYLVQCLLRE
jgi:hypothetical protein